LELAHIGYFSKPHGVKGHLVLKEEHLFEFEKATVFFVEVNGNRAPYFISGITEAANGFIVAFEDLDNVEKARALIGKKVFVDAALMVEEDNFSWNGYELIDKQFGSLGFVQEVTHNGEQVLLSFLFREKEVILPLVEKFIEKIDEENKKVFFNAPEGLIDVYLQENEN
jgi:16S rRNA processing protein RimM